MFASLSEAFSSKVLGSLSPVVWRGLTAIDPHAIIFSVPAVLLGYIALAAPEAFAGWAFVGAGLWLLIGLFAAGGRAVAYRLVWSAFDMGLASGGEIIKKAACLHACHLLVWRALIAAAGLAVSAGVLFLFGGRWWAISLVIFASGAAFLAVTSFSRFRLIDLALGALQPPVSLGNAAVCSLVFWPPARSMHLRALDGRSDRPPGSPSRLAIVQANLSRYEKDGRGPLPDAATAFHADDGAEASACRLALLCYFRHLLPIALLIALLGFPFSGATQRWIAPHFPSVPFGSQSKSQDGGGLKNASAPSTKTKTNSSRSDESNGSSSLNGSDNQVDAGSEGGPSTSASRGVSGTEPGGPVDTARPPGSMGTGEYASGRAGGPVDTARPPGSMGTGEHTSGGAGGQDGAGASEPRGNLTAVAAGDQGSDSAGAGRGRGLQSAKVDTGGVDGATAPDGSKESGGDRLAKPAGKAGSSAKGGAVSSATTSASSVSDKGENVPKVHDSGHQPSDRSTPPPLDPSQSVKPPAGDELLLKSVAAIYGPEGGAPEALRVFRLIDPGREVAPTRIEKSIPAQNLPAWVGAVIGSTIKGRGGKP